MTDAPLPRRRVAKKTTVDKFPPTNPNSRNSLPSSRSRRATATDDNFDDMTEYIPSGRSSTQSVPPIRNNEVKMIVDIIKSSNASYSRK